jgi:hypothetical protein
MLVMVVVIAVVAVEICPGAIVAVRSNAYKIV